MLRFLTCAFLITLTFTAHAKDSNFDLAPIIHSIPNDQLTVVLLNPSTKENYIYNPTRALQEFLPASTFKIPHSLIALDLEIIKNKQHVIKWDGNKANGQFWAKSWSKDQSLESAMKHSAYWYFQKVALMIGLKNMKNYLKQFEYGNQDISAGLDQFWLSGNFKISPIDQVLFLEKMLTNQLSVSEHAIKTTKEILLIETTQDYQLYGKTGTANITNTKELLWFVGFIELKNQQWIFALNMEGEQAWEEYGARDARKELILDALNIAGVINN